MIEWLLITGRIFLSLVGLCVVIAAFFMPLLYAMVPPLYAPAWKRWTAAAWSLFVASGLLALVAMG